MTRQSDVQQSMNDVSGGCQTEKVSAVRTYDQTEVQKRMSKLRAEIAQKEAAELKRAEELAAVHVEASDVALVSRELNCSEESALHKLRAKKGDVVATLCEAVGLSKAKDMRA